MDCVIPGHSVRLFCSSIQFLSKVGTDTYFEFDPIRGLTLRAMNDAKSAYACIHYEPAFFERCTAPLSSSSRSKKRKQQSTTTGSDDEEPSQSQEPCFSCRVVARTLMAPIRHRKNVASLRICSSTSSTSNNDGDENEDDNGTSSSLCLSFEFLLQKQAGTDLSVLHRVQAADATSVSAIVNKDDTMSEIVASPTALQKLLSPIFQRTTEASLIVHADTSHMVQAASFHHEELLLNNSNSNNPLLQQSHGATTLKTETGMAIEELEELNFVDDREESVVEDNGAPMSVNDHVILVFPIKEVKALLQFCSSNSGNDMAHCHELLRLGCYFHWGGKPMKLQTLSGGLGDTPSFSVELILATLDHKLLQHGQEEGVKGNEN